ncbi:amidohydrolase [Clostridioides sp. ES-S-0006-03]|uniref:M20 metallopeptidase family protein n=1 Tax=Clostridioides sp. ES-S-0006-03 TaxID=2770775 RepID=UPI001D0C13A7|nr:amidohydrolase [Clostridioides sp. ES-S-0006-03]
MINIKALCHDINDWVIDIRRDLHKTPELGLEEFQTKKKIIKYLDEIGISYIEYENHTGVTAYINVNPNFETIAIRADIDALPITEKLNLPYKSINLGKMHACGHDAHTAILLGTCNILFKLKDYLNVNVKFFFQPAEETIGGAKLMIEDGCMKNPDVNYIFGLHVNPNIDKSLIELKYNTLNASTDTLCISVYGSKCHGAYPHQGVDAIVISAHIITALQTIVSRNTNPTDSVVISLGKIEGGIKENIVCDKVVIKGTLRTLTQETRDFSKKRIREVCDFTCKTFGGNIDVEIEEGYPSLINSNSLVDYVKQNAVELFGKENILIKDTPTLGAEDFSYFLEYCEGVFYHLGCANQGKNINSPLHTDTFDIDEDCLITGVMLHSKNVLYF